MAGELKSITIADNSAIDAQGGIGPSGDGWVAECVLADLTNTAGTLDASKLVLQVSDPGYTADGVATTVNRTIKGTTFLHRPHPNGDDRLISTDGTDLTLQIALEDSIYAGTTIVSAEIEAGFYDGSTAGTAQTVTNASTFQYKKPIGAWLNFNGVTSLSPTVDVEFVPAHESARNGQQVACIEFYADDGVTTGPSVFSNSTSLSSLVTQGNIPEVFTASVDLTGLTQEVFNTINARVYPWIGDSGAIMDLATDGYAWPTVLPLTPLRVFNDSGQTYGTVYAYVDGVGAGTPAADADEVTAKLNPFATLQDALQGTNSVSSWNLTNRGRNDYGGGVVRFINEGTGTQNYDISGNVTNKRGVGVCTVEADPLALGEVTLTSAAQALIPGNKLWRNLSIVAGGDTYLMAGWDLSGTPSDGIYLEGCRLDNAANKSGIIWHAYRSLRNCTFSGGNTIDLFQDGFGPDNKGIPLMAGCVSANRDSVPKHIGATGFALALIGNDLPGYSQQLSQTEEGDHGMMIVNNRLKQLSLNNPTLSTINNGVANIQNIYEHEAGVSVICMNAFADGDLTQIDNYLEYYNTAVGDRSSRMYNDAVATQIAPIGLVKTGQSRFSVWDNYNIKDDRFNEGDGSGSVGNWRYEYSVGNIGNVSLFGNTRRQSALQPANDSSDEYLGSYWQESSLPNWLTLGATETEIMDTFENWVTTPRVTPAVGGNYRLTEASTELLGRVPANMAALSFDLDGEPRLDNGNGAAGAYEFVSASTPPPPVPGGYIRYTTNIATADTSTGSIFEGVSVENNMTVDIPSDITVIEEGGFITGQLIVASTRTVTLYYYYPSDGTYEDREVTLQEANEPPVVPDNSFVMAVDTTLTLTEAQLLAGSSDPEDDTLSVVSLTTAVTELTLTDNGNSTYDITPDAGYLSTDDVLVLTVTDGTNTVTANPTVSVVEPTVESGEGSLDIIRHPIRNPISRFNPRTSKK